MSIFRARCAIDVAMLQSRTPLAHLWSLEATSASVGHSPQPKEASMEGDIVERLRRESNGVTVNLNPWPTMREAADAIALCRARVAELEDGRLRALLAPTVGNLTIIGYQNALAQVRADLSGT